MNEADALDIMQAAVWTVLVAAGPAVLAAMIVGVAIAFIQALTQVQEMTLTFVPKIVTIMIVLGVAAPFVGAQIALFSNLVFSRVQSGF
ncbi:MULTISPECIES: flagellar biosynthetic protein FliQ [Hyphomicrobiales]|jgi:flagellar biosynthetic protein FliQ|uniref:Flagellar biosynthetic protein FliQ n=7 Tax=Hyphomicrobiales TaxID=356 RepID=A0AA95AJZ6_RHIRH|nr:MULTISPECIES: flagellar biosynthetic protein FliQ [Rhizobium/Agrobacterium group]AHK00441.1 flagellar biosynthesis protein FliQ [Agrobacterium tumefaciens LBA4213 (Ach5)]AKC06284.1 flagellar biosynthetic protein FliQ [Agrobacterium tumefaciens]ANV24551.1 flagellar export apparatus protein FliQ [Rhizobium sp. S41]AUC08944.1 flagellar export apparatus protein FliQ [Rhizobium sp. Y9]EHJ98368.1 flagellar biosynthesis protein FliQ [Agrobacterium tumefaciens 5A]EKJ96200.1 flagellar biosynthesis 